MQALAELPTNLKPRSPLLTPSQNAFCALLAKGYKKGEAWRRANPKSIMTKDGCSVAASKLLKKPEIQARLKLESDALLATPAVFAGVLERDQKRLILATWVQDEALPHEMRLAALREDSILAGHNAPKVSVSVNPTLSMAKELLESYASGRTAAPERRVAPVALLDASPALAPVPSLGAAPVAALPLLDAASPAAQTPGTVPLASPETPSAGAPPMEPST